MVITDGQSAAAAVRAGSNGTSGAPAPAPRSRARRWGAMVAELYDRSTEPWVPITIGGVEVARARLGSLIALTAAEGTGKSSCAIQSGIEHASSLGPWIYATRELGGDEAVGRSVGQSHGESWERVLCGAVARDRIADVPRMWCLEADAATPEQIELAIGEARAEYPGQPIIVAVDYLQIFGGGAGARAEERLRVADMSQVLRDLARRQRVVIVMISQSSRAGARALRTGELIGADTAGTGAESSQIERDASITLALGDARPLPDGTTALRLSTGKGRMQRGDTVRDLIYRGLTGRFEVVGEARPASEVRAEKLADGDQVLITAAEAAIVAFASKATEPCTRLQLGEATGRGKKIWQRAVANLLSTGGLVEVERRRARAKAWLVWTRTHAEAAGIPIANSECES